MKKRICAALCAMALTSVAYAQEQQIAHETAFVAIECIGGWEEGIPAALAGSLAFAEYPPSFYSAEFQMARLYIIEVGPEGCVRVNTMPEDGQQPRRFATLAWEPSGIVYELYEFQRPNGILFYVAVMSRWNA